jgi:hypothetical protein
MLFAPRRVLGQTEQQEEADFTTPCATKRGRVQSRTEQQRRGVNKAVLYSQEEGQIGLYRTSKKRAIWAVLYRRGQLLGSKNIFVFVAVIIFLEAQFQSMERAHSFGARRAGVMGVC